MCNRVQSAKALPRDNCGMSQIEPQNADDNPKLNERLWQTWIWKNRERDRAAAVRRRRVFQVALGVVVVAAVVENLIR